MPCACALGISSFIKPQGFKKNIDKSVKDTIC